MIDEEAKRRILDLTSKPVGLGGWLGLPYEESGCIKFAVRVYQELGIEASEEILKQARDFERVERPEFGDIAVFHGLMFGGGFHVAVMLDYRRAIQSNPATNGVSRIDISRFPWGQSLRGFYRHKSCC